MKKYHLLFGMLLITLTISGFAQSRCFICIDNSSSMKNMNFYERLINAVADEYKTGEIHMVPFGDGNPPRDFVSYTDFSNFIKETTFSTTDFVRLCEFIENNIRVEDNIQENSNGESNTDQFIIITDGEHDLSTTAPFQALTYNEICGMLNVINRLQNYRNNIKILHILDSPGPENPTNMSITRIQNHRRRLERTDTSYGITDSVIIKGLTHDFLMNLTTTENYYHCKNRRAAVNVFFKEIFNISVGIPCDESTFLKNIPLQLKFSFVTPDNQKLFKRFIDGKTFCVDGIDRDLKVTNDPSPFVIQIRWYAGNSYIITINEQIIWEEKKNKKISLWQEFNSAAEDITEYLSKIITKGGYRSDPQFREPHCQYSIKFEGDLLFPFITSDDFKILKTKCGGAMDTMPLASVSFAHKDKRVYFEIPMISTRKLQISLPHDRNQTKLISLGSQSLKDYWENMECTISDSNFQIPIINYDFRNFLTEFGGTLLFYSASNQRYAGMISRPGYVQFYQGQSYVIYHVPFNLENDGIKSITWKEIKNQRDIGDALNFLREQRIEVFETYEDCLTKFENAADNEKANLTRKIADSNGFLFLLNHLREIRLDENKKMTMINIIETLDKTFNGLNRNNSDEKPFKIIELITSDIPNFSNDLRRRYLAELGGIREDKISTIINLLSNPFQNLQHLKYYLQNPKSDRISPQNSFYFSKLEGN